MKISAQEEYGLRCLMQVARTAPGSASSLRHIAESEGISAAYAGKLLWILSHAGLVKSVRGPKGGYVLGKPPAEILLSDVIKVLDEDEMSHHCQHFAGEMDECVHTDDCTIKPVVQGLHSLVRDVLSRISLQQLMAGQAGGMAQLTQLRSTSLRATGTVAATAHREMTGVPNEHD
ncbi:MAG TPA: Rrf2 family transcriptional regulator [Blastocatellia bacterium]|nr:Rrf2 family transcriptional regulator [Blastocatellia bacterium]